MEILETLSDNVPKIDVLRVLSKEIVQ
jgi:hypothetical protein